jgi:uncharacterized protein YodC (DUF2158 family)
MAKFKSGDFVQLKSGGPKMTVTGPAEFKPGYYACKWFAGTKLNHGQFAGEELQAYDEAADKKTKK